MSPQGISSRDKYATPFAQQRKDMGAGEEGEQGLRGSSQGSYWLEKHGRAPVAP